MDEKENNIDVDGWFAVCDAEENIQVIFPTENFAGWYLEKMGWTGWEIRHVFKDEKGLFFLEQKHSGADNDENQSDA